MRGRALCEGKSGDHPRNAGGFVRNVYEDPSIRCIFLASERQLSERCLCLCTSSDKLMQLCMCEVMDR